MRCEWCGSGLHESQDCDTADDGDWDTAFDY